MPPAEQPENTARAAWHWRTGTTCNESRSHPFPSDGTSRGKRSYGLPLLGTTGCWALEAAQLRYARRREPRRVTRGATVVAPRARSVPTLLVARTVGFNTVWRPCCVQSVNEYLLVLC